MPSTEWFAYCWPNRRSEKPVVEITLDFKTPDRNQFPRDVSQVKDLLVKANILAADEVFPENDLPQDRRAWYTSLLAQTALLFQRKAGHRVNMVSQFSDPAGRRHVALVEHEHCDVGMTAVKLAVEMMNGKRKLLAEPFGVFRKFALERQLPRQTEAIMEAARQRDIPVVHLERNPNKREAFDHLTGGECVCRNGLIMLGYGQHRRVLDGTWSLDLQKDLLPATDDPESASTQKVAEHILDCLYPEAASTRIPVIAITGTNGKTTTTRMVNHIMQQMGRKAGMVCTDGVFVDGREIDKGDKCADAGHLKVLTHTDVDMAVLETHHAGIMFRGFCFDWCDIAVCLNVTEDHLGVNNVNSVEQMAEVKCALVERARHAAVLYADNEHSLAMVDKVSAEKLCLVSMKQPVDHLEKIIGNRRACSCVLERIDGSDWVVIHDESKRIPIMAVNAIPATFDGSAGFNVSNAMHAMVASYLAGVEVEFIRSAMGSFECSYETTPGRLNVFDDLPFRIVMDFAHNPDGMRLLCEFTDRQTPTGRKLIAFSGSVSRRDSSIRNMGRSVAGHFDFYICKEYVHQKEKNPRKVAHLLKEGLLDSGVAEEQTMIMASGKDVTFEIFDMCRPGDLLVMLEGHVEKHLLGQHIEEYASKSVQSGDTKNLSP